MKSVLIVDDSFFVRRILGDLIKEYPGYVVADAVKDGQQALKVLREQSVDVMTLDLEMPSMDGLETLEAMKDDGIDVPVVVISAHVEGQADRGARALELGAAEMLDKPGGSGNGTPDIGKLKNELKDVLDALTEPVRSPSRTDDSLTRILEEHPDRTPKALVIGGSTGAPKHLRHLLAELPASFPLPIAVVQHISEPFLKGLRNNLSNRSPLNLKEISRTTPLRAGEVYLPAREKHLVLRPGDGLGAVRLEDGEPVNSARPSVDVLFESAADLLGADVIAVLFTGMGEDGARGMKRIHDAGGLCLAQDRDSSTVYGMPAKAEELGAVDCQFDPDDLPEMLQTITKQQVSQ